MALMATHTSTFSVKRTVVLPVQCVLYIYDAKPCQLVVSVHDIENRIRSQWYNTCSRSASSGSSQSLPRWILLAVYIWLVWAIQAGCDWCGDTSYENIPRAPRVSIKTKRIREACAQGKVEGWRSCAERYILYKWFG